MASKAIPYPVETIVSAMVIPRISAEKICRFTIFITVSANSNKNGQHLYTVRIHIHGNYLVGRYATDVEAAIAYNKAIDILRNKGVTNNFLSNYVEDIAPSRYAEIYSSLPIAPGILNYPAISPNNQ